MTYDEAFVKLQEITRDGCTVVAMKDFLDMAVALGLLKFDEPKSAEDRLIAACKSEGFAHSAGQNLVDLIGRAGLAIVEKGSAQ